MIKDIIVVILSELDKAISAITLAVFLDGPAAKQISVGIAKSILPIHLQV